MIDATEMDRARKCQQAFMRDYAHRRGILGIGLGLTEDRSEATIEVLVDKDSDRLDLPEVYDGLEVRLTLTTGARALEKSRAVKHAPAKSKVVRR